MVLTNLSSPEVTQRKIMYGIARAVAGLRTEMQARLITLLLDDASKQSRSGDVGHVINSMLLALSNHVNYWTDEMVPILQRYITTSQSHEIDKLFRGLSVSTPVFMFLAKMLLSPLCSSSEYTDSQNAMIDKWMRDWRSEPHDRRRFVSTLDFDEKNNMIIYADRANRLEVVDIMLDDPDPAIRRRVVDTILHLVQHVSNLSVVRFALLESLRDHIPDRLEHEIIPTIRADLQAINNLLPSRE